jgi:hypothetical protein
MELLIDKLSKTKTNGEFFEHECCNGGSAGENARAAPCTQLACSPASNRCVRSAFFLGLSCRGVTPAPKHRSLWLQQVEGDSPDRPPLEGHAQADIAILGGGYVGRWTALRIKEHDPACDVAVLEQDICGGGASGRNGGFVLSWWPKLSSLTKLFGAEEAIRICRGSETAITEIQAFCEANHT